MSKVQFNVVKSEPANPGLDKQTAPPTTTKLEKVDGVPGLDTKKVTEQPKRGPGRPKGTGNKPKVVPLDVAAVGADEPEAPKKKPGRPKKANGKKGESSPISIDSMSRQILGFHAMLDVVFPGTMITEGQADTLAGALVDVADAWDFKVNRKVSTLLVLAGTVAIIELPNLKKVRFILLEKQKAKKAVKQVAQQKQQDVATGQTLSTAPAQNEIQIQSGHLQDTSGPIAVGEPFRG